MCDAVDADAALLTNTHTTERCPRLSADRNPGTRIAADGEGGGDTDVFFYQTDLAVDVDGNHGVHAADFKLKFKREGKYGAGAIAQLCPHNWSASSSAVASEVVMPRPS